MKQTNRNLLSLVAIVAFFGMSMVPLAHARICSQAGSAGRWAFTVTGSVILPTGSVVPVMQVGTFREDREGNIKGSQTRSLGGSVGKETLAGTPTINPDFTGSATTAVYDESGALVRTTTVDYVLDDDGKSRPFHRHGNCLARWHEPSPTIDSRLQASLLQRKQLAVPDRKGVYFEVS